MLCKECEEFRFGTTTNKQPRRGSSTRKLTIDENRDTKNPMSTATVQKGKGKGRPAKKADKSCVDTCPICHEDTETTDKHIECCSCKRAYHQQCTGLSCEVFDVLLTIVSVSGWVCPNCREDLSTLRLSVLKHGEELSDIRVSLALLWDELQNSKKVTGLSPAKHSDNIPTPVISAAPRATEIVVHRVLQDNAKRKMNVVISGLPECICNDNDRDRNNQQECFAFTKFCEENLSVKPPLAQRGCRRIGKLVEGRPRKLLVHLTSEQSASNLLSASKHMLRSGVTRNFYINPDLSPAEAQIAYEQRQKRRAVSTANSAACSVGRTPATATAPTTTTTTDFGIATTVNGNIITTSSNLSVNSAEFRPTISVINNQSTATAPSTTSASLTTLTTSSASFDSLSDTSATTSSAHQPFL